MKYLTQTELRRFFRALPRVKERRGLRDKLLFGMIYRYGLRASEAARLPFDAVDLKARTVTVTGIKGGLTRTYPIFQELLPMMRRWKPVGETYFDGRTGAPLTRFRIYQLFRDYAEKAGIYRPGMTLHSLRHSAAVHALDAGAAVEDVRDLLRHRNSRSTDVYATLSVNRRAGYLQRLNESPAIVRV